MRLGAVVFIAGAATLAVEICASRLLAPYFGNSTVVWANVIGLILVYLSVGYWFGGRLADRTPQPVLLGRIVLVAAVAVAIIPFVARPFLDQTVRELDTVSLGAAVGSFFAAIALFAIPVTFLGMVSPFAIRVALPAVERAGTVAGRLYGLSTIGAILGTFCAAIVAIPFVGTQRTLLGTAVLLALAAGLLLGVRWQVMTLALAALLAIPPGAIKATHGLLYEGESQYQYIDVRERDDGSRVLELNEGVVANSVWYPHSVLTGGEWDMFLVVPPLVPHRVRDVLILGNAGGSTARALAALYPDVRIDGVELDPKVTEVARRYLGLDGILLLHVITADARAYLRSTHKRYDLIAIDTYRQPYIPFQVTTREFFALVRSHLTPGGAVALNVARVPGDRGLLRAIGATVRHELGQAWAWDALRFNTLLFALNAPVTKTQLLRRVGTVPTPLRSLVPLFRRTTVPAGFNGEILSDDRAPVEWLSDRAIVSYVARGGRLENDELPTAPPSSGR
jgi:spermidine synthase